MNEFCALQSLRWLLTVPPAALLGGANLYLPLGPFELVPSVA